MNLIFDFDGTICDSLDITIQIINEYLKTHGKPPIEVKFLKEKGVEELIKKYKLNRFQILVFIYLGRRRLASHIKDLKSFKGLPRVLKELSTNNKLGIVSSNSGKNILKFLKNNNLDSYFNFVLSSPTIFDKAKKIQYAINKHKLNKANTVYIGDEVRDIEAARKVGIKSVSVTWGFANKKLLKSFHPDFFTENPEELLSVGKQLQH